MDLVELLERPEGKTRACVWSLARTCSSSTPRKLGRMVDRTRRSLRALGSGHPGGDG